LDSVIKRVLHGGYEVQELEINVQDLPDEIIDRDLGELQTREAAHDLLEKKVTKEPPNTQIRNT
jgi:hypothetical protein